MDKQEKFSLIMILLFSISLVFNIYLLDRYDMPEEINCISNNPSTPDTLTGFSDGKQIHLQYLRRNR